MERVGEVGLGRAGVLVGVHVDGVGPARGQALDGGAEGQGVAAPVQGGDREGNGGGGGGAGL